MSKVYQDGKGFLIRDGVEVFGEDISSETDVTAAPYNVSILRADFVDKKMEKVAADKSITAAEVTDAETLVELSITDARV